MRKLKILIVEDQENYITSLKGFLQDFHEVVDLNAIVIARTFTEARTIILSRKDFDLSILDYLLDDAKTCLDLIEETKNHIANYGQIVFTTIDTIEHKNFLKYKTASKYLLLEKPFSETGIAKLFDEIKNEPLKNNNSSQLKLVLNLGSSGEKKVDDINNILFIQGSRQYCDYFIFEHGNIAVTKNVSGTLDDQVALLNNPQIFLRVHKSYIVNIPKIERAKRDKPTTGWLSFLDTDYNEITNPHVARYSTEHENYTELRSRTGFEKI